MRLKDFEIEQARSARIHQRWVYTITKLKWASHVYYFVFGVMHTIFHYDLLLISLNDKIIRYVISRKKNQMFLLYFNYLEVPNSNLPHF